jgi:hypothetical protein
MIIRTSNAWEARSVCALFTVEQVAVATRQPVQDAFEIGQIIEWIGKGIDVHG